MSAQTVLAFFALFCLVAFELVKPIFWIIGGPPYRSFPQFGGPEIDAPLWWLLIHQTTGIIITAITALFILGRCQLQTPTFLVAHSIFCAITLGRADMLPFLSKTYSLFVGAILMFALHFCYWLTTKQEHKKRAAVIYLSIISSALFIDFLVFLTFLVDTLDLTRAHFGHFRQACMVLYVFATGFCTLLLGIYNESKAPEIAKEK